MNKAMRDAYTKCVEENKKKYTAANRRYELLSWIVVQIDKVLNYFRNKRDEALTTCLDCELELITASDAFSIGAFGITVDEPEVVEEE